MNILSKLSFPPLVQRVYILFPFLQHSFTSLGLFYSSLFSVSSTLDAVCHFFIVVAIVLFVAEKYFSLLGIHCEREYIVLLVLSFVQPFSWLFLPFSALFHLLFFICELVNCGIIARFCRIYMLLPIRFYYFCVFFLSCHGVEKVYRRWYNDGTIEEFSSSSSHIFVVFQFFFSNYVEWK